MIKKRKQFKEQQRQNEYLISQFTNMSVKKQKTFILGVSFFCCFSILECSRDQREMLICSCSHHWKKRKLDKSLARPPTYNSLPELSEIHQEGWNPKRRCSLVFQVWILYSTCNILVITATVYLWVNWEPGIVFSTLHTSTYFIITPNPGR